MKNNKIQFICFPYAGGGASVFYSWKQQLMDVADVLAIQYPGHESRFSEKPFTNMEELVRLIYKEIGHGISTNCVLFWHSIGARIAYEFTKYYEQVSHNKIRHLIVSGSRAPHFQEKNPIHALPDEAFIKEIKRFKCTPNEILENQELLEIFLPMLRADFELDETYFYTEKRKIRCPITILGGKEDPEASEEELKEWKEYTDFPCVLRMFSGEHFFIKTNEKAVLNTIKNILLNL